MKSVKITRELYGHQKEALKFAIKNKGNCALFHEPGLGKTRTSLEIFTYYKKNDSSLKLLVICPLSLVNSAWGEDIQKFTRFSYSYFKTMKKNIPDIISINYEALISKKQLPLLHKMFSEHKFMCVIDESSRLKNHKSITTKTILSLANFFKYRIIASGTPMPNSELELWGQLNFIEPELLKKSFYQFRNTYFHLERNGRCMDLGGKYVPRDLMKNILRKGWKYSLTQENRTQVMDIIMPYTHWVKKADAIDLPEKIDEIREIALTSKESSAYQDMKRHLITEIKGVEITAEVALTKLMKLRQATSGFFYSKSGEIVELGKSSKMKELMRVLEELGDQQVIIWANFRYEIESIQKQIEKQYGKDIVTMLYGQTKDKDASIEAFKKGKVQYLIANPQSASHGLTFINCSTQVFYSLSYSYEQYQQARDRTHRIGQIQSCLYIHLIAKSTIDEDILSVLQKKQTIQEAIYRIVRCRK